MISHKHKYIFIHIPKCAGTSIERSLPKENRLDLSTKHVGVDYYLPGYDDYFKFSIVRNPWDLIVSSYFHSKTIRRNKFYEITKKLSFNEFVKFPLSPFGKEKSQQLDFLKYKGEICVDFIGRFENINKDFKKICDTLNIKRKLPIVNHNTKRPEERHYSEFYNQESIDYVAKRFNDDIEFFKYKFFKKRVAQ